MPPIQVLWASLLCLAFLADQKRIHSYLFSRLELLALISFRA